MIKLQQQQQFDSVLNKTEMNIRKKEIGFILSPGSMMNKSTNPPFPLPTGGNFLTLQETKQRDVSFAPDSYNSIVLLLTPFFEAPLIRVMLDANGRFASWHAYQIPGYEYSANLVDPLKQNKFYAYRIVASSLTATTTANMVNTQGTASVWYQPLSLDTKKVYSTQSSDKLHNPITNMRTLDRVPINRQQIANVTKTYYQGAASEGAYVVSRHTDPNVPFTYRDCDENKATVALYTYDSVGLQAVLDAQQQQIYYSNYLAFADDLTPGTFLKANADANAPPLPVSAPSCNDLCGVIFSGLSPNAGEIINVKLMITIECIPKYNSDRIGYAVPMKPRDEYFLSALARAEQQAPRVGNAASNSAGSFLNVLNGIMNSLSPVAQAVAPMLPKQYGAAVSTMATVLPQMTNTLNSVVNGMKDTQKQVQTLSSKLTAPQVQTLPNVVSNYPVPTQQFTPAARRPVSVRPR